MGLLYRVRVVSTGWSGAPGLNTFYFQNSGDPSIADTAGAQEMHNRVHTEVDNGAGIWANAVSLLVDPVVDILTDTTGALSTSFGVTPTAAVTGAGGASMASTASALCGSLLTSDVVNGHRVRGRVFVSPLPLVGDSNGTPTSSQVTDFGNFLNALATVGAHSADYVVWHRPVNGAGGSSHIITSTFCRDKFAVLRSRRD